MLSQSADEWRPVFLVCSGVCLLGAAIYMLFGSGELQPWTDTTLHTSSDDASDASADATNNTQADALQGKRSVHKEHNATANETPPSIRNGQ